MILIDGYNLLFLLKGSKDQDLQAYRENLIKMLIRYQRLKRSDITIIFDSGKDYSGVAKTLRKKLSAGVCMEFTPWGTSADEAIVRYIKSAKDPCRIRLVTSDRRLWKEVKRLGTKVINSKDFAAELGQTLSREKIPCTEYREKQVGIPKGEVGFWLKVLGLK
jgi:predicted RNA-binding protein with PIN domain